MGRNVNFDVFLCLGPLLVQTSDRLRSPLVVCAHEQTIGRDIECLPKVGKRQGPSESRAFQIFGYVSYLLSFTESKIDPETIKNQAAGAVLELSGAPWVVLGCLGALLEISGSIRSRFSVKLGRRWARDERKMNQVGSKLRPRWAMLAPRWPCWAHFGKLWLDFGSIF